MFSYTHSILHEHAAWSQRVEVNYFNSREQWKSEKKSCYTAKWHEEINPAEKYLLLVANDGPRQKLHIDEVIHFVVSQSVPLDAGFVLIFEALACCTRETKFHKSIRFSHVKSVVHASLNFLVPVCKLVRFINGGKATQFAIWTAADARYVCTMFFQAFNVLLCAFAAQLLPIFLRCRSIEGRIAVAELPGLLHTTFYHAHWQRINVIWIKFQVDFVVEDALPLFHGELTCIVGRVRLSHRN